MLKKLVRATFFAVASTTLISSVLFLGCSPTEALMNPVAGKPLSFDKMLPYLSDGQPIYRSGKGDYRKSPNQVAIQPSNEKPSLDLPKGKERKNVAS